jgi:hypothetical protein
MGPLGSLADDCGVPILILHTERGRAVRSAGLWVVLVTLFSLDAALPLSRPADANDVRK